MLFVCVFTEFYSDRIAQRAKSDEAVPPSPEIEASIKDYRHSGQYYPGPMYRLRPKYSQDATKDGFNYCKKQYVDPKHKMGYLEIFRCLDHRFALGFHQGTHNKQNKIKLFVF